ncbi:MAG: HlyC/CorC family transporter [Deltaproteobacteria bacterium]|nr:HlyC/CorC family transporter [Deltaproteobacteria bacterium]
MNVEPSSSSAPLVAACLATLASALFACADTALTSLSDARLAATVIEAGERFQGTLTRLEGQRERVQSSYLAGRVLASAVAVAAGVEALRTTGVPAETRLFWGLLGLVLYAAVVQLAATLGRRMSDWVVPRAARYLFPLELALLPFVLVTASLAEIVAPRRLRKPDPRITETEVEIMVDQGAASGAIDHGNAELIRKVLEFPDLTARDAMVPRKKVVAIRFDTPLDEIADVVMKSGHSRYPVYREDIDDVFGLLYAKDLFRVLRAQPDHDGPPVSTTTEAVHGRSIRDIVREPVKIVPESRPLSELLRDMRQSRQHMAIVVDEFGGTSGVVTLEDVIEEIVGDIRDEHDPERAPVVALPEGGLLVDGTTLLCDLTGQLGRDLDPDDEYDTIGGMITDKLGTVPTVGTTLRVEGFELVVRDADEKHVTKVEIVPREDAPAPSSSKAGADGTREAS